MEEKKQDIRNITVKELCELIKNGEVRIGDRFLVARDIKNHHNFELEEIIYNITDRYSADTITKKDSYDEIHELVEEFRYMSEGGHAVIIGSHKLGTKSYHSLFEVNIKWLKKILN